MRRFTQTELWDVLVTRTDNSSYVTTSVSDAVLDNFIAELHSYCREESDLAERTRTLNIAASDLAAIRRCLPKYEAGKKRASPICNRPGHSRH